MRIKIMLAMVMVGVWLIFAVCLALAGERTYTCDKVVEVRDGDTFVCELVIDSAFRIQQEWAIRIADVNCPEIRGWNKAKGFASKAYLETVLGTFGPAELRNVRLNTKGRRKLSFDRIVADVYLKNQSLKELLISHGGCGAVE